MFLIFTGRVNRSTTMSMISLSDLQEMFRMLGLTAIDPEAITRFYECQRAVDPNEDYSTAYRIGVLQWNLSRLHMEWDERDSKQMSVFEEREKLHLRKSLGLMSLRRCYDENIRLGATPTEAYLAASKLCVDYDGEEGYLADAAAAAEEDAR
jgi:hypothetical protein